MGEDNRYDLTLAPSELEARAKEGETKDEPEDADISVVLMKPLGAPDLPSRLLLDSVVCLLRSLVVGMAVHCQSLAPRHTRSVSSLLHLLLKSGAQTGDQQSQTTVAAIQHDSWVTLGFLRGVASPPHSSAVFCTPHWIQLLLGIVESALPSVSRQKQPPFPLVQQVLTLRLLRAILPAWEAGREEAQQEGLVDRLFRLLGRVLVLCSSPFIQPSRTERGQKHRKVKLHASLTASSSSTVAEEIVVLVRRLHPLRAWNGLINRYIGEHLRRIPQVIATMPGSLAASSGHKKEEEELQADVETYGPVLAILMAIGGLDTRPRLGGLVHHEELGPGTVVKIEAKSKVVVLFHGRKAIKSCHIGAVKAVSGV
jgi:E3 ubiquitin-protein ligase HERC2